jgi:glycosyltransferase 2 family protein
MAEAVVNNRVATRRRVRPSTVLKLVVTLGLTVLVLRQAGISAIAQTLVEADWRWAAVGLVLAAVAMVINVFRWQLMLRGQGARVSLATLIRLYLVGMFFSNVLPSRMGGDVVRAYGVSLTATSKTRSAAAVIMDRLVGAISVLVLGMGAIALSSSNLPLVFQQVTVVFFGLSMVLLALMLYRNDGLADRRLKVLALSDVSLFGFRIRPRLESALNALRSYSRSPGVVIQGFLISLVANGCSMLNLYLYAQSVRAPVGLGDVATISPFVLAIGLLPISINGIGTIELAFVVLFGTLGIDEHVAIAIAILRRLAQLILSLLGGLLYAFRRFS